MPGLPVGLDRCISFCKLKILKYIFYCRPGLTVQLEICCQPGLNARLDCRSTLYVCYYVLTLLLFVYSDGVTCGVRIVVCSLPFRFREGGIASSRSVSLSAAYTFERLTAAYGGVRRYKFFYFSLKVLSIE